MNEHPWAIAILLGKRKPKAKNILVGSDRVVINALERRFDLEIGEYDPQDPKVFSTVEIESAVPLGEHASCAFWRNPPVSRNEPLLTYIVSVMAPETKDMQERSRMVKNFMYDPESARDFDVLYWRIRTAISANQTFAWDKQPWEGKDWIGKTDPDLRLARLYHDLRSYLYVSVDNKTEIKTLGLSGGKVSYLKGLKLGINCVTESLSILSLWRFQKLTGQQAAFLISTVWS